MATIKNIPGKTKQNGMQTQVGQTEEEVKAEFRIPTENQLEIDPALLEIETPPAPELVDTLPYEGWDSIPVHYSKRPCDYVIRHEGEYLVLNYAGEEIRTIKEEFKRHMQS